jgi:hypothetical protein
VTPKTTFDKEDQLDDKGAMDNQLWRIVFPRAMSLDKKKSHMEEFQDYHRILAYGLKQDSLS